MKPRDSSVSKRIPLPTSRRKFHQETVGLTAGAAVIGGAPFARGAITAEPLLPTINLGKHEVTRLIIGGNPIYGYSHFNKLLSQYQTTWHTPERVVELIPSRARRPARRSECEYRRNIVSSRRAR